MSKIAPVRFVRGVVALIAIASAHGAAVGCGSDSSSTNGNSESDYDGSVGGLGGGGADAAAGGALFGTGGAVLGTGGVGGAGTGGVTSSGGAVGDAGCVVPATPPIDPTVFPACNIGPECIDGRCVQTTLLQGVGVDQASLDLLADCDATNKCVPSMFVAYSNKFLAKNCTSVASAEGRCLSLCITQIKDQQALLPKDVCADGELCAPCYDPRTGLDTGACHQGCDPGPTQPPVTFATCCGGNGSCVPASVVPEANRAQLGTDTCTNAGDLCAPTKLQDLAYVPPTCRSLDDLEGRCLPDCIPAVAAQASRLPQATCDAGELCAPCYDPITGVATGACSLNGDTPKEAPRTFDLCCNSLGHCVPSSILTSDQKALLGQDTCADPTDLCAPDVFADTTKTPEPCLALGTFAAEGRCIPSCVPAIAAQADRLDQSSCPDNFLCAPCYDPITGVSTGACNQNGDVPQDPPATFATCCGGNGICVPTALVPPANQSQLGTDTCTGTDVLCAPTKMQDPTYVPPSCLSLGGLEGRCLADCIPAVSAQASRLPQSTCDAGELCAPCYDPITGASTGACTLNGDAPKNPPTTFDTCCSGLGHCVPSSILTTDQQSLLGQDTCTSSGDLCAPDVFADTTKKPESCRALGSFDAEGRCIPGCVPAIAAQADRLDQSTCDPNFLCAPCYDPITGLSTGACNQNGDAPAETPKTFPDCCGSLGICVPTALVPPDQVSQLGKDSCTGTDVLCAPKSLTDPTVKPDTCTTMGNVEGRCLPGCLPAIQVQASNLKQETCGSGELCAPCYSPLDGTDTGACHINGDAPVNAPVVWDKCCAYNGTSRGTCVPTSFVPASYASSLPVDSCSSGFVCAPDLKIANMSNKFPTCNLPVASLACTPPIFNLGCKGGCVPNCLVTDPIQLAAISQGSCSAGELCAPCTDPLSGSSTGACD